MYEDADEVKTQGQLEPMRCMCHQGVTTKQRALCAVLTRAACARRGCSCHSC